MMSIVAILYNLIFFSALLFFIPLHIARGKLNLSALCQKFAWYPLSLRRSLQKTGGSVWIHAVSVGEVRLIKNLVRELASDVKDRIIISVTTLTGKQVADKLYPEAVIVYFPFDLSFVLSRAIALFRPGVFVSVETEIWPNLYYHLKKNRIPVLILNGRISDRAFRRYQKIVFILRKIFDLVDLVGTQNGFYKQRFLDLGLAEEKAEVTGNLKLSRVECSDLTRNKVRDRFYSLLKKDSDSILLIAASTHPGEEEMVLEAFQKVKNKGKNISLVLAPRHIRRTGEIEDLCSAYGFSALRLSRAEKRSESGIYILDTVGDLVSFFTFADICFVGGSLVDCGGHNILEPMSFSLPTLFGPFMANFREIEEKVLEHKAAIKVNDKKELAEKLFLLTDDRDLVKDLANAGSALFREGEDILKHNLEIVRQWLK